MLRLPTLFATIAAVALILGLGLRLDLSTGLTLTLPKTTYLISYRILCFGVATWFCLFAFLYSIRIIPWSAQAATWHFGLSLVLVALFITAALGMDWPKLNDGSSTMAIAFMLAFSLTPIIFLLLQGFFVVDGLRRCWPLLRG